jgi:peptidyl-prolyl cis-trans isomerase C
MPLVVNGETIDDSLVREEANQLRPGYYEMMGEGGDPIALEMQLREWSKENVIERVLLRQAAPEGNVDKLLESLAAGVPGPTPKEVSDYYKAHNEDFFTPEMVYAWHILEPVDETHDERTALANIERIERDLRQGLLFDSVAKELGWIPKGQMAEDLEREIFGLELRQYSGILRSNAGFHIVRVTERRAEGIPGFPEVREHVAAMLLRAKHQQLVENYIDALKAKAEIRTR